MSLSFFLYELLNPKPLRAVNINQVKAGLTYFRPYYILLLIYFFKEMRLG